jgi:hypothetical protein
LGKRIKITIDNTNIDSDLTHFPVPIVFGASVGQSDQDVSDIFDALELASVDDNFTGDDGDAPDITLWNDISGPLDRVSIQSNKLQIKTISENAEYNLWSNYKISGDFDIQVEWSEESNNTIDNQFIYLLVSSTFNDFSDDYLYVLAGQHPSYNKHFLCNKKVDVVKTSGSVISRTLTSGFFSARAIWQHWIRVL